MPILIRIKTINNTANNKIITILMSINTLIISTIVDNRITTNKRSFGQLKINAINNNAKLVRITGAAISIVTADAHPEVGILVEARVSLHREAGE